jgi:hypothetical protein
MQVKESRPILTKERNLITFWQEAVEHKTPKGVDYDTVLFIRIITPGDTGEMVYEVERHYPPGKPNQIYGEVKRNERMFQRFGEYIEKWKREHDTGLVVDGTPIDNWAQVDVRTAALLKHLGIFTVETLAVLGDSGISKIGPGGRALVEKAKVFVEQAKNTSYANELAEENRKKDERIARLEAQIEELSEAFNAIPEAALEPAKEVIKRRRGRPPKNEAAAA